MKQKTILGTVLVVACCLFAACSAPAEGDPQKVLSESAYKNVLAQYDDIWDFHEGLAKVRKGGIMTGTFGFVDAKGHEVISCVYDFATEFKGGLCSVKKDDKYGFINPKGEVIVPIIYEEVGSFTDDLAPVATLKPNSRYAKLWGFINKKGEVIVPIENEVASDFSEGMARLKKSDKLGYINNKGEYVVDASFSQGYDFSEGLAVVEKGDKEMVIDMKGNIIYTLSKKMTFPSWAEYHDGMITVQKLVGSSWWDDDDVMEGYLDKEGNEAIRCIYDDVEDFENGVAMVKKDGTRFYINTKGEKVTDPDDDED